MHHWAKISFTWSSAWGKCRHACETHSSSLSVPFVSVNIICALEENVMRLRSDERLHGHKSKWADVEGLTRLREIAKLLNPSEGEVVDLHHASTHHLDLDTTALTEKEAANAMISFL